MSAMDRSFIGAGSIYLKPADDSAPLLPLGNVSEFKFSFEEDKKELKNSTWAVAVIETPSAGFRLSLQL